MTYIPLGIVEQWQRYYGRTIVRTCSASSGNVTLLESARTTAWLKACGMSSFVFIRIVNASTTISRTLDTSVRSMVVGTACKPSVLVSPELRSTQLRYAFLGVPLRCNPVSFPDPESSHSISTCHV